MNILSEIMNNSFNVLTEAFIMLFRFIIYLKSRNFKLLGIL